MRRIKLRVLIEDNDMMTEAQGEVDISHLFINGELTSIGREDLLVHHFWEAKKTAEDFLEEDKRLKTGRQHD